jgi:hypothetical protein
LATRSQQTVDFPNDFSLYCVANYQTAQAQALLAQCVKATTPMPNKRKYTNATFTKRVDHEAGRHRPSRSMSEPTVCDDCGAVYANRRWTAADPVAGNELHKRPAALTVCPACLQLRTGEPRGFVYLDGAFYVAHHEEIDQLLRNEADRASQDNPLARIMECKPDDGHELTVSTTTEHLAQRLGHALEKAFGGKAHYDFSHENKLARVNWQRE